MTRQLPLARNTFRTRRTSAAVAALACGALLLTGCTSTPKVQVSQSATSRQLVFAHAGDATSTVLASAYTQMLESAGIKATVGDPVPDPAAEVLAGRADVVIGGSGDLLAALQEIPGNEPSPAPSGEPATPAPPGSPAAPGATSDAFKPLTAEQTARALHDLKLGEFALLDSAEANRTGTLVTTAATSAGKNLVALAQLPPLCKDLDFGVPAELSAGLLPELREGYHCTPSRVLPVAARQESPVAPLITDRVQMLAITAENAGIIDNGLVELNDARQLFAPQVLTPLITTREVGQDAIDTINKVSGALKQDDLIALNRAVTGRGAADPQTVAGQWLLEKSLVNTPPASNPPASKP